MLDQEQKPKTGRESESPQFLILNPPSMPMAGTGLNNWFITFQVVQSALWNLGLQMTKLYDKNQQTSCIKKTIKSTLPFVHSMYICFVGYLPSI